MGAVKDIGCCMWSVHWSTSIVNPNHRTMRTKRAQAQWVISLNASARALTEQIKPDA